MKGGASYTCMGLLFQCLLKLEHAASIVSNSESRHGYQYVVDGAAIIGTIGGTDVGGTRRYQQLRLMRHEAAPPTKVSPQLQQDYPFYHTSDELKTELVDLSSSCNGALHVRTLEDNGTSIDVVTVKKPDARPVNRVFILFGEHSRELISPESGLYFLRALCGNGLPSTSATSEINVPRILENSEFQIVINGNPQSRRKVEQGNYCLRANPNGVDLNRNWDEKWQSEATTLFGDSDPGPKPFSEAETRIFKRAVTEYQPTTFLTVHSGTRGMYMPWAYDQMHLGNYNRHPMMEVLRSIDKEHCQCPFGAAGKEVGYPCPGTCLDYAYGVLKTPYAFAFEIYARPEEGEDLKQRWDEKMKNGGEALLQIGSHLGHAHFRDIFDRHASDFVDTSSISKVVLGASDDYQLGTERDRNLECFKLFNPDSEKDFNQTVSNWAEAYIEMSVLIADKIKAGQVTSSKHSSASHF